MTGSLGPDWTVEANTAGPTGRRTVLVRLRGGRKVKVVVPPGADTDRGLEDAIAVAVAHLSRPPGPDT